MGLPSKHPRPPPETLHPRTRRIPEPTALHPQQRPKQPKKTLQLVYFTRSCGFTVALAHTME